MLPYETLIGQWTSIIILAFFAKVKELIIGVIIHLKYTILLLSNIYKNQKYSNAATL